jgi:hypothetical protein
MIKRMSVILTILIISGCSGAANDDYTAGDIRGINHTSNVINYVKVNGHGGPNISANGMGGGYCCVMLPRKWTPDLKAHIEWETDPAPYAHLPPLGTDEFREAYARHAANYQKHSAVVDIPRYGKSRCGITVHFLPCNQVKVTTVCDGYGTPNYPIKEPLNMKEPAQCPK